MFERPKNLDTAFRSVRALCIAVILLCFGLCGYVLYSSHAETKLGQERIYVLAGNKIMEAFASERKDNLAVEARDHVRVFHQYFFSLDPDEKVIRSHLSRALYLADGSAKRQYDNLTETGYYAGIISGNISQSVTIDSVLVDTRAPPFLFRCYGSLTITRPTSISKRNLVTQGYLRSVARSDHNPHGFLIEKWEILDNHDLSTEAR